MTKLAENNPQGTANIADNRVLVAVYILQSKSLSILIPKRRGGGFCKSVFGWHSANKNCLLFEEIKPTWFCGDTCDIDGFLQIDLRLNSWDDRFNEGVKLTLESLKQVFPFVTEFQENDELFWDVVLNSR